MIISKIITEDYIYFNLHAEEVITSNFIEDDNIGIYGDRLQISTIKRVLELIEKETETIKNIVFDFRFILACQPNLNRSIFELKIKGYKILCLNLNKLLFEELSFNSFNNPKNILLDDYFNKFYLFDDSEDPFTNIDVNFTQIFYNEFKNKIKKYINPHSKPHTSSFVYLTSYVDVKKFMSYEKEFMLFSLYNLANKIKKEWYNELEKNQF